MVVEKWRAPRAKTPVSAIYILGKQIDCIIKGLFSIGESIGGLFFLVKEYYASRTGAGDVAEQGTLVGGDIF
jgi:hypothetical protein